MKKIITQIVHVGTSIFFIGLLLAAIFHAVFEHDYSHAAFDLVMSFYLKYILDHG